MAGHNFKRGFYHLDPNSHPPAKIIGKITAVADIETADTADVDSAYVITYGPGIKTVRRSAEGTFIVTLADHYKALLHVSSNVSLETHHIKWTAEDIDASSGGTVTFLSQLAADGTDTDPDSAVITFEITAQP